MVEELRAAEKLLLTTHENPDGDALGSLLGDALDPRAARQGLADVHVAGRVPAAVGVPRTGPSTGLVGAPPEDVDERTVVFLDCGNIDRMPVDFLQRDGIHILNIDHHHDNTRFGTVNLVAPEASCTAEIVWRLAKELGAEITPPIADALYVGLVTDTGRFMYENTTPAAHRMAAELIEAGVEPHLVYRRLFEEPSASPPAAARSARSPAWSATTTARSRSPSSTKDDYEQTGALETDSEGIVDHLRAVEGTAVAVLVRELLADEQARQAQGQPARHRRARRRVAHRSRARRRRSPQAAGFTTELPYASSSRRCAQQVAASSA